MSSGWVAAAIAAVAWGGQLAVQLRGNGRWEGKVDSALALLTKIADDHENRIRQAEHARR